MPELPEVETVRRGLMPVMESQTITDVLVRRPDLRWPFPDRMAERLSGKRIKQLRRRSKYILVDLSSNETLLIHLGMSGRVLISGEVQGAFHREHQPLEKHDHVVFDMSGGARVTYNDARRFGAMDLIETDAIDRHPLLASLGPEPFGNAFNEDYLIAQFRNRNAPVKSVLLDQKTVAGLGNIYVCEALHRAGISPRRKAGNIAVGRVVALVPIIRNVLNEAIEAGGSSLRDHRQADGELGYFQHSFRVYDQEGKQCSTPDCGGTISRIVQSGRSTFYCAQCQR